MSLWKPMNSLIAAAALLTILAAIPFSAEAKKQRGEMAEEMCCRHYVEGSTESDTHGSWDTLDGAAITQWRRHAADQCGGFWNQWSWDKAASKSIQHSNPAPDRRKVTARGYPCK